MAITVRQSDLSSYMRCPKQYWFDREGIYPREQSSALSFGTAIHDAVLEMEVARDLKVGTDRYKAIWNNLEAHDLAYDYILPRNSHEGYLSMGMQILEDWWQIIQWDQDVVLGREHFFEVPLGKRGHTLTGTVDKLALRMVGSSQVVLISDYKTSAKAPTRDYLRNNVQFSAYSYASTQPEFWRTIPGGLDIMANVAKHPRVGEWVHLRGPKRIDAGERVQRDYNRLEMAVDALEDATALSVFMPNLAGDVCQYCPYRNPCGLPSLEEE